METLSVHTAAGHQKIPNRKPMYLSSREQGAEEGEICDEDSNTEWKKW